ncbi:MAG: hypothetical protein SV062_07260 [Thermodesulfobacteriota bacterium]|nr:hypothetical protein [Thermodesulfobacteriota bacterium]
MSEFVLNSEDKKQIILYELIKRSQRLGKESISSFVKRLMTKYQYRKGSERYFWKAIKELEDEAKLIRLRQGKRKILLLTQKARTTFNFPDTMTHLASGRRVNNLNRKAFSELKAETG